MQTASLDEWVAAAVAATSGARQNSNERWAQALFDCAAERDDELSFQRGDVLLVVDDSDANWWQMALHDKVGYCPAAYLRLV